MNDEMINHNDIPLGETFYLLHDGVKGFVEKDNKISMGCSLLITDLENNVLLENNDLYAGNDQFAADSIDFIRCVIYTGSPMVWNEEYKISVVFWDKYGKGRIKNNFIISCIDNP